MFVGFDAEDPVNPEADDALLRLCRIYEKAGIAAGFFLAGEKARVLRARGRKDVLDALKQHEICYHGNYWDVAVPPTRGAPNCAGIPFSAAATAVSQSARPRYRPAGSAPA
ncbi:hypothetical protein GW813_06005 [bacterium]|nr:hypothetical protein [Armatimonadota bacterium]NCQ34621.1 hypothetical protein [bacterium]PIX37221.1 MAG: hypothetical protein COZ57_35480 [Armatimonadetes bacterium CG_4_8_14_3_um_filter_66_20]PIY50544.1 MAG: hypothetical protein COZ06_08780 [Armatimonadetes bacterium CG_4_10_14_3_um_filter_66_18]PJB64176.1 MAG: hypothetical protein CO096_20165 [Armatimonadetes bacterium CG_4_9_14_3_um_filter_66_14]